MPNLSRQVAGMGVPEAELQNDIYCTSLESQETISRFPADTGSMNGGE